MPTRRAILATTPTLLAVATLRPAAATPETMQAAIRDFLGEAGPVREGRVRIDIPPLVENGNSVPLTVRPAL